MTVAVAGVLSGCGGNSASGQGGTDSATDGEPDEPFRPRGDGCIAPPPANIDPTVEYEWTAPMADLTVTSTEDAGPGSLREALAAAQDGQVVAIDASLAGQTVAVAETLVVPASITVDASAAPGFTLDGQDDTQIMVIEKGRDTVLVGLSFVNGRTDEEGGALKVRQADRGPDEQNPWPKGSIEVIGCRFEGNRGAGAGALFIGWRIDAVVRDSLFVDNDGTQGTPEQRGKSGGAIATRQNASLAIERCSFLRNRGAKSGAVYNILEPVEVVDSVFVDNEATEGSGAFFTDGGNSAGPGNDTVDGAEGKMILRRVRIEDNRGTGDGGAMLLWGYPRDVLVIEHSIIRGNSTTGDKGGAGRLHGLTDMRISDTVVADNHSGQQGGGLWIDGSGELEIVNTTFSGNSVERDAGGGFTHNGDGRLTVESCLFAYNQAGRAAGGFWKKPSIEGTVSNSIFAFNEVGENIGERHMGPRPEDGGGNIDYAVDDPDRGRAFEGSTFADPRLEPLTEHNGTWLHGLAADSPAVGAATGSAPALDARGAARDDAPDVGPFELGGSCQ